MQKCQKLPLRVRGLLTFACLISKNSNILKNFSEFIKKISKNI